MTATSSQQTRVYVGRVQGAAASIAFGRPNERLANILSYAPGRVVAYSIAGGWGRRCYVFRTLGRQTSEADALACRVVGVTPRVRLFVEVTGQSRCDRIVRLLKCAHAQSEGLDHLGDAFFVRLATASWRAGVQSLVNALLQGGGVASATAAAHGGGPRDLARVERR